MRKPLVTLVVLFFTCCFSFGQNWTQVGKGIGGGYGVNALCVYKGELYAGGWFSYADYKTVNNIAKWNGVSWSSVSSGIHGGIISLCVYKGELYVGGQFDSAGGKPASNIAKWNGTTWSNLGTGTPVGYSVNGFAVYNGKLYVGGNFDSAGGLQAKYIASWDSLNWSSIGVGFNNEVTTLYSFDSVLYAGGNFDSVGGILVNSIAQWNGSTWSAVGFGVTGAPSGFTYYSPVSAITYMNKRIYVGGVFTKAGGNSANSIASWDGANWASLGSGIYDNEVNSLCAYDNILYVGGFYDKAGSLNTDDIATWDGNKWDSLGGGIGIPDTGVNAVCIYNGSLYVGGDFGYAGNQYISQIAKWSVPVGINELKENNAISVYPNPGNGIFNFQLSANTNKLKAIDVYNMLGEKVYSTILPQTPKGALNTIDISSQPAGIYLYRITTENGDNVGSGKLIIQ